MKRSKVHIENNEGIELAAYLELPVDMKPHNFVIFAHCFTCNKNFKTVRNISRSLTSEGFGVLSLDFTGLGESEGTFSDTNFTSNIDDIEAAANYLTENHISPSLLVGHSLGGTAVIKAASRLDSVKAIATIGSPAEPEHVTKLLKSNISEIEKQGFSEVDIGGNTFKIKKQFLDDLEEYSISSVLPEMRKSFMFMHSPQDQIVDIENAATLFKNARHPKSFVTLDGADHLLSGKSDSLYAGSVIAAWAKRYIETETVDEPETDAQTFARIGSPDEKFTTQIKNRHHSLIADEPEKDGGFDLGPSPYELLNAALGACTVMTLRMYADHKKIDLQEVRVHLNHSKKHIEDCSDCENPNTKVDHISRELEIFGDLDEKQKQRMVQIADKCPVHKTLTGPAVRIETKLKK